MKDENSSDPYTDPRLSPQEARHLFSYTRQAFARLPDQHFRAWPEFKRTLQDAGLCPDGVIRDELIERLSARFTRPVLSQAGIYVNSPEHSISLWNNPMSMSFALFVLDQPLDEFLALTTICRFSGQPSVQSVIDRVNDLAPAAAKKMAGQFRQITVWSLADSLSDQLGAGFFSNYACLPKVRDVLENYIENGLTYGNRAIQLMFNSPEFFIEHSSFDGAMSSFRLHQLLADRDDLRRQAIRAFRASCSHRH